jgi:hypothetical protein
MIVLISSLSFATTTVTNNDGIWLTKAGRERPPYWSWNLVFVWCVAHAAAKDGAAHTIGLGSL